MTYTESATEPTVQRWQTGYEIPVDVTSEDITDEQGTYTRWTYRRVVTASLASVDIARAVAADFDGDPAVLAQAQAAALDAVTPLIAAHDDALAVITAELLGGTS